MHSNYSIDFHRLAIRFSKKPAVVRSTRSMDELPERYFDIGGIQDRIVAIKSLQEALGHLPDKKELRMWEFLGLETMQEIKEHGFTATEIMELYGNQDLLAAICVTAQRLEEQAEPGKDDVYRFSTSLQPVKMVKRRCL